MLIALDLVGMQPDPSSANKRWRNRTLSQQNRRKKWTQPKQETSRYALPHSQGYFDSSRDTPPDSPAQGFFQSFRNSVPPADRIPVGLVKDLKKFPSEEPKNDEGSSAQDNGFIAEMEGSLEHNPHPPIPRMNDC